MSASAAPTLRLVREAKIADLFGTSGRARLEASGVLARLGRYYVIFDNLPDVGLIDPGLTPSGAELRPVPIDPTGYEDIAWDEHSRRFLILVESVEAEPGVFQPQVRELDEDLRPGPCRWLEFQLDRPNKGLEGLTCVRRDGRTFLLGLCEGNRCRGGEAGRRPGGGRIHVFTEDTDRWDRVGTIKLPETVAFEDYSSLSLDGDRLAVVSQASSALWVGELAPSTWDVRGEGRSYVFPRDRDGRTVYGTVEGVAWTGPAEVVVVSDRADRDHPRWREKDQSIHVFAVPSPEGAGD